MVRYNLFQKIAIFLGGEKASMMLTIFDAMGDVFPRIARVNYRTGECIFIRDKEQTVKENFQACDWSETQAGLLKIVHPEDVEKCRVFFSTENMQRLSQGQKITTDTCTYRRNYMGELLWIQTVIQPIRKKGQESCVLIFSRNLDDAIKAEELYKNQLWQSLQKAKEADSSKEAFLQYMAENMQAYVNSLLDKNDEVRKAIAAGDMENAAKTSEQVEISGKFISAMLGDIARVTVSKKNLGQSEKKVFSLSTLLEECRTYFTESLQDMHKVKVTIQEQPPIKEYYRGDETRIRQILYSLLSNTRQSNGESGCTELVAGVSQAGEQADRIFFRVSYSGDISEKLSVGMQLAKAAAESMGGKLLREEEQEGSCYTLSMELEYDNKEKEPERMIQVLAVDDNPLNLEITTEVLRSGGFHVVARESGEAALQTFEESSPGTFQVILTDIRMPGMDGHELISRIRNSKHLDGKKITAIAITAHSSEEEKEKSVRVGMNAFLEKPFNLQEFNRIIELFQIKCYNM